MNTSLYVNPFYTINSNKPINNSKDIFSDRKFQMESDFAKRDSTWKQNIILHHRNIPTSYQDQDIQMKDDQINLNLLYTNINLLNNAQNIDKLTILSYLKTIRKELSKNKITKPIIESILNFHSDIINLFSKHLLDFKNSEIQLETIWILNNLSIYFYKYSLELQFNKINGMLVMFFNNQNSFSNNGVKCLIYEKTFRLIRNIIVINKQTLSFYLQNNILSVLFTNLNSPVVSLRTICLNLLSKIYTYIKNDNELQYYKTCYFDSKVISYYKFIKNRIEKNKNFDEVHEFYWLLNDIFISFPSLACVLYFNESIKDVINSVKNILNIASMSKLIRVSIRLLSNLIAIASMDGICGVNGVLIANAITAEIMLDIPLIQYMKDMLTASQSQYNDYNVLIKDILHLMLNISHFGDQKLYALFHDDLIMFISNNTFLMRNDIEIARMVLLIYYKLFILNNCVFCANDNEILLYIKMNYLLFSNDRVISLIMLDYVYLYLQSANIKHDHAFTSFMNVNNINIRNTNEISSMLNHLISTYLN